jgi:pimeloyl-ACP methyl ester carboxylesterase
MAALILPVLGEWAVKRFNARYAPEIRAAGTIKLCFADPSRYPEQRMHEAVDELRGRLSMPWADTAVLRSMRALARSQFVRGRAGWTSMRKIAAPTLVLWGDSDRLVAPDLAPYVAAAIPDSRLLVMERIGHTAMMEDPVGSARAMLGLVEDAAAVRH